MGGLQSCLKEHRGANILFDVRVFHNTPGLRLLSADSAAMGAHQGIGHQTRATTNVAATAVMQSHAAAERCCKARMNPARPSAFLRSCVGIVTAVCVPTAIARRLNSYRKRPNPRRSHSSSARCTSNRFGLIGAFSSDSGKR